MYEGPDGLIYGSRAHYEKATEYWGLINALEKRIAVRQKAGQPRPQRTKSAQLPVADDQLEFSLTPSP